MKFYELMDPHLCGRICVTLAHSLWQMGSLAIGVKATERFCRGPSAQSSYVLNVAALFAGLVLLPPTFAFLTDAGPGAAGSGRPAVTETTAAHKVLLTSKQTPGKIGDGRAVFPPSTLPDATFGAARPFDWRRAAPWFFASYLVGVALMLGRLAAALVNASRLARRATPITAGAPLAIVRAFVREWSMRVTPLLAETNRVATPRVVGLLRPTILLPAAALNGLSCEELEMVLAHELAHVRRHDIWVVLAQRLAETVLFFNPALWYLSRRISLLREYCCDDAACRARPRGEPQIRYAALLLKLVDLAAPHLGHEARLASLAAAGRSPSELRRRVARLLDEPLTEPLRLSRGAVWAAVLLGLVLVVLPRMAPSQAPQTDAADAPKPATKASDSGASNQFSFGGKVEALALGTHEQENDHWWDARGRVLKTLPAPLTGCMLPQVDKNGKPMASLPIAWKRANDQVWADAVVWRRIIFQIHDLPEDADVKWRVEESRASAGGEVSVHGQWNPKGYLTRYFGVPPGQKTVSLKVGVATGEWKKVAEVQPRGRTAIGNLGHGLVFSEEVDTPHGASIVVSHDYFDQDFRVVAIDKRGALHDTAGRGGMSAGKIYQTRATFSKLKRDDIDHFEFQTRDYEYVVLRGLPVQPPEKP